MANIERSVLKSIVTEVIPSSVALFRRTPTISVNGTPEPCNVIMGRLIIGFLESGGKLHAMWE